jgi:protein-S-isoprenylcysteine O-methyltransferase Ste14
MATAALSKAGRPKRGWLVRGRSRHGFVIMALVTCSVLLSAVPPVEETWAGWAIEALAWLTFLAGAAFRMWATLYIGARKGRQLVCDGPYSVCRNPLYLGTILMACSFGLFLESLTLLVAVGCCTAFGLCVAIPSEERSLTRKFGESYARYCREVPRFWPAFHLLRTPEVLEVHLAGLESELWRAARWVWVPVFGCLLMHLRTAPWWPHYFHLP